MKKIVYLIAAVGIAGTLLVAPMGCKNSAEPDEPKIYGEIRETVRHIETVKQLDDIVANNENVAVDIGTTWCGPCRRYEPIFKEVAKGYKGRVVFCKVVLDELAEEEHDNICEKYKVKYIPKTMLFKDGKEVYSDAKFFKKEELKSLVDKHLLGK